MTSADRNKTLLKIRIISVKEVLKSNSKVTLSICIEGQKSSETPDKNTEV